jgi:hypothetical protein
MASAPQLNQSTANPASTVSLSFQANAPGSMGASISPPLFALFSTAGTLATQQMSVAQVSTNPIIMMTKTAGMTVNLNLPNPTACTGSRIRILQNSPAAATSVLTVTCTGGALFGGVIINTGGAFVGNVNSGLTTITFLAASTAGDYLDIFSNGATWQVSGMSSAVGFTFA